MIFGLSGCATSYQKGGIWSFTGGYDAAQIEGDVYRVSFSANGYSSRETAQTYWLYQCADLALTKGYTGFQILSDMRLGMKISPEQIFAPDAPRNVPTGGGTIIVPIYSDNSNKPFLEGDIRLLKGEIAVQPPKIFDAAKLKEELKPLVDGKKCGMGNVCPHVHKYLFPDEKIPDQKI